MINITIEQDGHTATADIPSAFGPALRAALNEIRNELGERVVGPRPFAKEDALTRALTAVGRLAAAINTIVPEDDPQYR